MVTVAPVLPINSQVLPGHNQEVYQQLQAAVQATPPHQVWMATCDDLPLQRQLAATLEESLQDGSAIASTQLVLDAAWPEVAQQVQQWGHETISARPSLLQLLGIEQLTYRGSDAQYQFLQSLHQLPKLWQQLGCSLLIWVPRPWLKQIRREVPQLCTTVFEFMGEPTPISAIAGQPAYQAAFSPVRRWQFLGKPAPEVPSPTPIDSRSEAFSVQPGSTAVPAVPSETVPSDAVSGEDELGTSHSPATADELSSFSDDLWQQLQADLSEFEQSKPLSPAETTTPVAPITDADEPAAKIDELAVSELPATPPSSIIDTVETNESTTVSPPIAKMPAPDDWAIAYELRDRVQAGDHSPATLAAAVQAYEQQTPQLTATYRTEALNDLGSLYWLWAQQATTVENYWQRLLRSSELYEAALSPVSPNTEIEILNRIHSNLGSVYSLLAAHQDPLQYLAKAVRAFHRALQYAPVEVMPEEYATLQTHLGTAYWSLSQHTQEANHLHRAIAAYQEALRQSHPQQQPQAYAQLQNNLGIALWSLSRHERPIFLLEQSIKAYQTALAYRTLEHDPAGCAATHNNLGTAYWDLGGHYEERSSEQQQAWRQAIAAYEATLLAGEQAPAAHLSFDQWATHHSVGVVYDQLAIALAPDATAQQPLLTKATTHYIKALTGWQAMEATTTDTAFQALVRNLHLQSRYLGMESQQQSLSQVPVDWLPEIWRQL